MSTHDARHLANICLHKNYVVSNVATANAITDNRSGALSRWGLARLHLIPLQLLQLVQMHLELLTPQPNQLTEFIKEFTVISLKLLLLGRVGTQVEETLGYMCR